MKTLPYLTLPYLTLPYQRNYLKIKFLVLGIFLFSSYSTISGQCTLPIVVGSTVGVPSMSDAVALGLLVETSGTITSQNFRVAGDFLIDVPRTLINCTVQVENNGFIEFISGFNHIIRNTQIGSCASAIHNMEIIGGSISIENNSIIRCGRFDVFQSTFIASNSSFINAGQSMELFFDFATNSNISTCSLDKVFVHLNNQSILALTNSVFDGDFSSLHYILLDGQSTYLGSNNQFISMWHAIRTNLLNAGFKYAQEIGSTVSRPPSLFTGSLLYDLEDIGLFQISNSTINGLGGGILVTNGNTDIEDNVFNFDPGHSQFFHHPGIIVVGSSQADILNNSLYGKIDVELNSGAEINFNSLSGLPSLFNPIGIDISSSITTEIDGNEVEDFLEMNFLFEDLAKVSARYNTSSGSPISYELENSRLTLLECNEGIQASTNGLGVKNNCFGLVHRGSTFNNVTQGLKYDISTATGQQINNGNRFFNYNIGGTLTGSTINSEYIVNPSAPEEYPVPLSPPTGWFFQNGTSSYQCLSVEDPPYGDPRSLNTEILRTMLDCYSQDMSYNDGLCFSILQSLYSIIEENLDQIEDADLLHFYDNNTNTAIGKLPTSEDILKELQQAKIEMPEVVLNFSIEDIQNPDVVAQFNAEGASWYNSTRDAKNQVLENFRNQIHSVSATNEFIQTNIDVTHFLLDYLQLGSGVDYDTTFLTLIASGCVHEHGNAVYLARSICKGLGLDFYRADFGDCMNTFELIHSETIHNANHQLDEPNNSINIYPNPAGDFIHIDQSIEYRIVNSVGTIVGEGYSQNGSIDIHMLPIGVYLLQDIASQKVYKFVKQ